MATTGGAGITTPCTTCHGQVDKMPLPEVLAEIDAKVDITKLEETLMREGLAKFADPMKGLLKLIAEKRRTPV